MQQLLPTVCSRKLGIRNLIMVLLSGCMLYSIRISHEILERMTPMPQPLIAMSSPIIMRGSNKSILIVYAPADEWIERFARQVAMGARLYQPNVSVLSIYNATYQDVVESDAIILGSPVYNAQAHPDLLKWINTWDFRADLSHKIGAAFVTSGGMSAGEELVNVQLLHTMMIFRMIIVGGSHWTSAFGASAITEESPFSGLNPAFLHKANGLGSRVAQVLNQFSSVH